MERGLNESLLQDCRTGWLLVEQDYGGKITDKSKLIYALQCTGRNPSQRIIEKYWTQYEGSITFTQYCTIMRREKQPCMDDLLALFTRVDRNGDGFISADELMKLLTKKGEPMSRDEAQAIINDVDLNADGKLDYIEFCHLVLETAEDCMRAARLKVQTQRHEETEKQRMEREREKKKSKKNSKLGTERREKTRKEIRRQLYEGEEKLKMKDRDNFGSVLYPSESGASIGTEPHSSLDDISSDLPVISPTSLEPMSPTSSVPLTGHNSVELSNSVDVLNNKKTSTNINDSSKEDSQHTQDDDMKNDNEKITLDDESSDKLSEKDMQNGDGNNEEKKSTATIDNEDDCSVPEELEEEEEEVVEKEQEDSTDKIIPSEKKEDIQEPLETDKSREPNHLSQHGVEGVNSTPIYTPTPPKPPKHLEEWNSIQGKGCFYFDKVDDNGDSVILSHQYTLYLPSHSHVWIEMCTTPPGNPLMDMGLYIFKMNDEEQPTQLITYTQHYIMGAKWVCRLDLEAGNYALLPYTSGCLLQPCDDDEERGDDGDVPLVDEDGGRIVLTPDCIDVFTEIFNRHDLDGNSAVSHNEFDFFNERTRNAICDDETWKVVNDNFELNEDGEITLKGFLDLHEMTANDEDGGEAELWNIVELMGYNRRLKLQKACPFVFEIFTEECDGEVEILPMADSAVHVNPALCILAKEKGILGSVRDGGDDVVVHTLVSLYVTTIAVENKSSKKQPIQVDCSRSDNCYCSRDSAVHIIEIGPNTMKIACHLVFKDPATKGKVIFIASLIKK